MLLFLSLIFNVSLTLSLSARSYFEMDEIFVEEVNTTTPASANLTLSGFLILSQEVFSSCAKWTFERVFTEIFLGIVFFVNVLSSYILVTAPRRKRRSTFMSSCLILINISFLLTVLHLLAYPFSFSWIHLTMRRHEMDGEIEKTNSGTLNISESNFQYSILNSENVHPCQQEGRLTCRISGFLFGLFVYFPLSALSVMSIDTALCAFRWKLHRYRPHTASAIRLTLLIGFSFAIVTSFGLPALGIGTRYHYHKFLKICWLSVHMEDYIVQGFAYFILGFGCFLLLLIMIFGYFVSRAYRAELSPVKQMIGYQCKILFGQYMVVKSKHWVAYARLVLWMDVIAVIAYLPLTVGYIICYRFLLSDIHWFNLVIEASTLVLPTVGPFLLIGLSKSHLARASEIFKQCCSNTSNSRKVFPLSSEESDWSAQNSLDDYAELQKDSEGYLKYDSFKKLNKEKSWQEKRIRFAQNAKEWKPFGRFDRLREISPSQNHFLRFPLNPNYENSYNNRAYNHVENHLPGGFMPLSRHFSPASKNHPNKYHPPAISPFTHFNPNTFNSTSNNQFISQMNRERRPLFFKPHYRFLFGQNSTKKSFDAPSGSDTDTVGDKWKISQSFYSDFKKRNSFPNKRKSILKRFGQQKSIDSISEQCPDSACSFTSTLTRNQAFGTLDSFKNSTLERDKSNETLDKRNQQSIITPKNGIYDDAFLEKYAYLFTPYPKK